MFGAKRSGRLNCIPNARYFSLDQFPRQIGILGSFRDCGLARAQEADPRLVFDLAHELPRLERISSTRFHSQTTGMRHLSSPRHAPRNARSSHFGSCHHTLQRCGCRRSQLDQVKRRVALDNVLRHLAPFAFDVQFTHRLTAQIHQRVGRDEQQRQAINSLAQTSI